MVKINKNSKTPLYLQLMDILIDKIEIEMAEHEQLLSEREICETYDVSRTTVRQTLDELEKEGYIYRVHGKGTFISPKKLEHDLVNFYSFTEEMKKLGKEPSSEVVGFEITHAGEKAGRIFGMSEEILMYKITRIRKADGVPMMYETTYLPFQYFEGLTRKKLEDNPMYDVLINDFKVKITSAEEHFQPIITNKLESIYLEVPEGIASLKIERYTYDNTRLIEYTKSVSRGDMFKYRVQLKNK